MRFTHRPLETKIREKVVVCARVFTVYLTMFRYGALCGKTILNFCSDVAKCVE